MYGMYHGMSRQMYGLGVKLRKSEAIIADIEKSVRRDGPPQAKQNLAIITYG